MRTTAIFNAKGGVGKTITTVNLAAELAARGKKVLVIDADPQCDTSRFLMPDMDGTTIYDVLCGMCSYAPKSISQTTIANVDALPGSMELTMLDVQAIKNGDVNLTALRDYVEVIAEDDEYDYTLIDCPPSFTAATTEALAAVNDVIIPIKPDAFSIRGMNELRTQIAGMRTINPRLRIAGILLTMMTTFNVSVVGEKKIRDAGLPVYQQTIRRSVKVDESTFMRMALRDCMPNPKGKSANVATDYRDFTTEYMEAHHG